MDLKDDIWKMRWLIQTTFLSLGLEVLVVDSDIVFFRNPFEHFHFDADQEAMTDHFFPREQLWTTWLRPAEHINTGFIFARPSPTLIAFLVEFIDRHYHEFFDRALERDGMDQRVYNRYVLEKFEADPPGVFAVYEELVFSRIDWQRDARTTRFLPRAGWLQRAKGWPRTPDARRVKIRLLDPAEIAHGMNYFWRKAHRLRPGGPDGSGGTYRPPAVAHVNGVDPKQYFLRDRNVWYVDEWSERFGERPSFMTYDHPRGLSLKDDFEYLMAAIEVAAYFRRRVVLPDTMNCANSPAYETWKMNETLRDEPGCTYDYFAHANGLYEVYSRVKPYSVEAGLKRTEPFQSLMRSSFAEMPTMQQLRSAETLRDDILSLQSREPGTAAFDDWRILHLSAMTDIRELRDGLRRGDFGFRMNPQRIFDCAHQQMLTSAMACLDEPYIEEFGPRALAKCEAVPQGCGPVGVCCCWPFWGYGEKLQYFTGVAWNLPCNCGVDLCEGYNRPVASGTGSEFCCRHTGDPSLYPNIGEGVFPCKEPGQWSGLTATEDAHTYTTTALSDFLKAKRTAAQTFHTCRLDREMRRGEHYREVSLRWCNLQVSAFLLREDALARAKAWWQWLLNERRNLDNASLVVVALDGNGSQIDNTHLVPGKLRHDLEQLTHLVKGGAGTVHTFATSWRESLDTEWLSADVVPRYQELVGTLDGFLAGRRSQEELMSVYSRVKPFFNRAIYVPDVALPSDMRLLRTQGREEEFNNAARALRSNSVAVIDDFLTPEALSLARELLADSTVWYASKGSGAVLKAQLKDGLHADLGLRVAQELRQQWELLTEKQLLDIVAYKFESSVGNAGLPLRCEDGVIAMDLWVVEDAANSEPEENGLRVHDVSVPLEYSYNEAHGLHDRAAVRELVERRRGHPTRVPYRANRAVLWRATRVYETDWDPLSWSQEYHLRRVDWLFLFGQSQVRGDTRKRAGSYVPSFEGREDSWGGHYYAKDHDHR